MKRLLLLLLIAGVWTAAAKTTRLEIEAELINTAIGLALAQTNYPPPMGVIADVGFPKSIVTTNGWATSGMLLDVGPNSYVMLLVQDLTGGGADEIAAWNWTETGSPMGSAGGTSSFQGEWGYLWLRTNTSGEFLIEDDTAGTSLNVWLIAYVRDSGL